MPKQKNTITEYRNYYLPLDFPVLLLSGDHWKISDIPSGRLHFHNCLEIGVCHSYDGIMEIYKDSVPFKAGDVTCIPRNVPHTTYSSKGTESRWSYLFINPTELFRGVLPASLKDFELSALPGEIFKPVLSKSDYPKIHFLALSIIEELESKRTGFQMCAKGLLLSLYIEIWRIQAEARKDSLERAGITPAENALIIAPVLEYIEDNYMHQFSMEDLADLCHLSPTHFRRIFHTIMGTNPLDYVNTTRIMKSCNLLRSTEESILSISESVGFHSVSSYNRCFIQLIQMSPRNYRLQMQQTDRRNEKQTILEFSGWMAPEK